MRIIKPVEFDPSEGNFSRASTGTYFDKDGVLRTAAVDEPRWNYTFEDGEWVGPELLVEGQSTNLLARSASPSTWARTAGVTLEATLTRRGIVFGQLGASGTFQSVGMAGATVGVPVAVEAGSVTKSFYLIPGSLTTILDRTPSDAPGSLRVPIDIVSGVPVAGTASGSTAGWAHAGTKIKKIDSDLYKIEITYTCSAASMAVGTITLTQGDPGPFANGVAIGGVQLEQGTYSTSYIPTTTAQVTRAADIPGRIVSNVPENDAPVWTAGTYAQADRVIQNHHVYEALAETTTDSPTAGLVKTPPTWLDLGVTNPWRTFDEKIGTVTTNPEAIRFSIRADRTINALAFFGVDAGSIRVTVTDPSLGRVFEYEASPVSTDGIDDWYQYLFAPIELVEDFVVLDVPAGTYGTIDISLEKPGGEAKLGALVLGQTSNLGVALYGTSIRLRDFSRKERDDFGNFVIQERDFSKVAEFDVAVDTANISAVQRTVAQYRAKPVVWIGEASYESTIIYGFCTDFGVSISGPTISDATFSVEGLN